jgi:Predicted outer membrane protein
MEIICIPNERAGSLYNIRVVKIDRCDDEIRLAGAVFDLFELDECSCGAFPIREDLTTNENGEIFIKNLAEGYYKLIEKRAPCGYVLCCECEWVVEASDCFADCENTVEIVICNSRA